MGGVMDSTLGSFNPTTNDPNGGLTGGQLFARKAIAGGLQGAGSALQSEAGGKPQPVNFQKLGQKQPPVPQPPQNNNLPYQSSGTTTDSSTRPRLPYQDNEDLG